MSTLSGISSNIITIFVQHELEWYRPLYKKWLAKELACDLANYRRQMSILFKIKTNCCSVCLDFCCNNVNNYVADKMRHDPNWKKYSCIKLEKIIGFTDSIAVETQKQYYERICNQYNNIRELN